MDICAAQRRKSSPGGVEITSPGYPDNYPSDVECVCRISLDDSRSGINLLLYDLHLETKDGRCGADWLMVEQGRPNDNNYHQLLTFIAPVKRTRKSMINRR